MFFDQLISALAQEYDLTVLSRTDAPIVRDVAILDGSLSRTEDDIVYFILPGIRLSEGSIPKQAIFSGEASALPCACAASVKPEQFLSAFNYARKLTENSIGSGLKWDRADDYKASWIVHYLKNKVITDKDDWADIAEYHSQTSKKLLDACFPFLNEKYKVK